MALFLLHFEKKLNMKKTLTLLLLLPALLFAQKPAFDTKGTIDKMLANIDKIKTLSYTMKGWERMTNGKEQYSEVIAKLQVNPQLIYLYSLAEPNKDVEIMYNESLFGKKALVNAGRMIPNLKLDPFGGRMRDNQHHTILNTGYATFGKIIKNAMDRQKKEAPADFDKFCVYEGDVTWNGINCYKISITDPTFKYVDYVVKEGDNVEKLEREKFICGYLIIEKNPGVVKDFWSLKAGQKIKIPSSYAKKSTIYVDKSTLLPLVQIMSDEKGQFEKYEFHNLKLNPTFKANEFTEDFEGYKF